MREFTTRCQGGGGAVGHRRVLARWMGLWVLLLGLLGGTPLWASSAGDEGPVKSIDEVVDLVLQSNANLKGAQAAMDGADKGVEFAGLYQNPVLTWQIEDVLGTGERSGFSEGQTTLSVNQTIPLGGDLKAARSVAEGRVALTKLSYRALKSTILAETIHRYVHVLADQHRLAVALDAKKLALEGVEVAQFRVDRGAASQIEVHRARIALSQAKLEEEHAEHELLSSKRRLSSLWGASDLAFSVTQAGFFQPKDMGTYDALFEALDSNLTLQSLAAESTQMDRQVQLTQAQAKPDLTTQLGGRRNISVDAFSVVIGASIPIALFNKNQAELVAIEAEQAQKSQDYQAKSAELSASLFEALQELGHANEQLQIINSEIMPDSKEVLSLAQEGFKTGRFSQLALLEAQKSLMDLQEQRITAAEDLMQLVVEINLILGAQNASDLLRYEPLAAIESGASEGENHANP